MSFRGPETLGPQAHMSTVLHGDTIRLEGLGFRIKSDVVLWHTTSEAFTLFNYQRNTILGKKSRILGPAFSQQKHAY